MMRPAFHGDSVRRQVAEMIAITTDDVARWPVGEPFPLYPRMQAITLEVILRTVIGVPHRDAHRAPRSPTPGRAVPHHRAGQAGKAPSRDDGAPPGSNGDSAPPHSGRRSPRRMS